MNQYQLQVFCQLLREDALRQGVPMTMNVRVNVHLYANAFVTLLDATALTSTTQVLQLEMSLESLICFINMISWHYFPNLSLFKE